MNLHRAWMNCFPITGDIGRTDSPLRRLPLRLGDKLGPADECVHDSMVPV